MYEFRSDSAYLLGHGDVEKALEAEFQYQATLKRNQAKSTGDFGLGVKSRKLTGKIDFTLSEDAPLVDFRGQGWLSALGPLVPLEGQLVTRAGGPEGSEQTSTIVISLKAVHLGKEYWKSWSLTQGTPDESTKNHAKLEELPEALLVRILKLIQPEEDIAAPYESYEPRPAKKTSAGRVPDEDPRPQAASLALEGRFFGSDISEELTLRRGEGWESDALVLFDSQGEKLGRVFNRVQGFGDDYLTISTSPMREPHKNEICEHLSKSGYIEYTGQGTASRKVFKALGALRELTGAGTDAADAKSRRDKPLEALKRPSF